MDVNLLAFHGFEHGSVPEVLLLLLFASQGVAGEVELVQLLVVHNLAVFNPLAGVLGLTGGVKVLLVTDRGSVVWLSVSVVELAISHHLVLFLKRLPLSCHVHVGISLRPLIVHSEGLCELVWNVGISHSGAWVVQGAVIPDNHFRTVQIRCQVPRLIVLVKLLPPHRVSLAPPI